MVAFAIMTIAYIGLVGAFPFGIAASKEAENMAIASYLAQQKIEQTNSLDYENINVGVIETKARLSNDASSYLYNYQRETTASYVDGNLTPSVTDQGIKKISTSIYYTNAISKTEKIYNVTTLISQK